MPVKTFVLMILISYLIYDKDNAIFCHTRQSCGETGNAFCPQDRLRRPLFVEPAAFVHEPDRFKHAGMLRDVFLHKPPLEGFLPGRPVG